MVEEALVDQNRLQFVVAEPVPASDVVVSGVNRTVETPQSIGHVKEKSPFPDGYGACVYVDSATESFEPKPLAWSPNKRDMSITETFALPDIDEDVVVFVSTGGQEDYYQTISSESRGMVDKSKLEDLKKQIGADKLIVLEKTNATSAEFRRTMFNAMVISDVEAHDVAKSYGRVTRETINFRRDVKHANAERETWKKRKELDPKIANLSKNRWVDAASAVNNPKDIFEWSPKDGKKAITLPIPDEFLPRAVIKVPVENGNRYYRYSGKVDENAGGEIKMGYLEEVTDKNEAQLVSNGAMILDSDFLRRTFDSYGRLTQETMKWQVRDDTEKSYKDQALSSAPNNLRRIIDKIEYSIKKDKGLVQG